MSMTEIGSLTAERKSQLQAQVGTEHPIAVWELEDAPPGSTSESLLVFDRRGLPLRVAGPTHYHHLADGRVLGSYSGGTHYSEAITDSDGKVTGEKVTRIAAIHQG